MPPEVEVLVGSDLAFTMMPEDGSVRRSCANSPSGFLCKWGWSIVGPTCHDARANKFSSAVVTFDNARLNEQMDNVFESDKLTDTGLSFGGIHYPGNKAHGQHQCDRNLGGVHSSDGNPLQQQQLQQPSPQQSSKHSIEDMRALKIMQDTVRLVDGQYEVRAKFDKPVEEVVEEMNKIPSANTAIRRLHCLGDKLADNPDEWNMVKTHVNLLV